MLTTLRNIDELCIGTSPSKWPIVSAIKYIKTFVSSKLFTTIVCCCLQHVEIKTKSVSASHRAKCPIFRLFAKFGGWRRRNEKGYRLNCFSAKSYQNCFLANYLLRLFAAYNTSKYRRYLYRHVTGRNVRFSNFLPSSAVDVVETKTGIGQIVLALKCIMTFLLSGLFATFVCSSQHIEILTNSVSARHRGNVRLFQRWSVFGLFFSSKLFTAIVCCSQHVEIYTNFVSARYRAKCPIFRLFAKFGGRRRRNQTGYRPDCFCTGSYQDCSFERIIYHKCRLLTARRNIDELCIGTLQREKSDFRIFCQVRQSTSSKRKGVSARLFQRWSVSGFLFQTDYLPRLSAVHNTSKYWRTRYRHFTVEMSDCFSAEVSKYKRTLHRHVTMRNV